MIISATEADSDRRIKTAFKERIEFELRHTDKLDLSSATLLSSIADWCVHWHYTPKMIGEATVKFLPNEMPRDLGIWSMPCPDPNLKPPKSRK